MHTYIHAYIHTYSILDSLDTSRVNAYDLVENLFSEFEVEREKLVNPPVKDK